MSRCAFISHVTQEVFWPRCFELLGRQKFNSQKTKTIVVWESEKLVRKLTFPHVLEYGRLMLVVIRSVQGILDDHIQRQVHGGWRVEPQQLSVLVVLLHRPEKYSGWMNLKWGCKNVTSEDRRRIDKLKWFIRRCMQMVITTWWIP